MEESNAGDAESEFMNMNDDCMREILKHLNGADLHNVAEVCSRLRALAIEIFAKKPDEKTVTVIYGEKGSAEYNSRMKKFVNYLRIFGPYIESVRLRPSVYRDNFFRDFPVYKHRFAYVLRLLLRYSCGTLKSLEMNWFDAAECTSVTADEMRPLFSGLSKLTLNNCVLSIEWIAMCNSLTGLFLFRTDMHNEFALPLRLEHLKELKIETHSYYAAKHFPVICYINHPESLEHFDIDSVRMQEINESFFQKLHTFKNMKTMRLYRPALYVAEGEFHDVFRRLADLTELVWGYTPTFSHQQLLSLISIGQNLERLVVMFCNKMFFNDNRNDNPIDGNLYRTMLDKVRQRPNQKALSVIIIGDENRISRFRVTVPMHPALSITCLVGKDLLKILDMDKLHKAHGLIKISAKEMKGLQERGLIP